MWWLMPEMMPSIRMDTLEVKKKEMHDHNLLLLH